MRRLGSDRRRLCFWVPPHRTMSAPIFGRGPVTCYRSLEPCRASGQNSSRSGADISSDMSSNGLSLETIDIIGPEHYEKNGYPHAEWTYLRKHKPVFYCQRADADPFWAITKHADIIEISKQPRQWLNGPRLAVFPNVSNEPDIQLPLRHLLNMDPPIHGEYRALVSRHFTPRAVRELEPQIERIAK